MATPNINNKSQVNNVKLSDFKAGTKKSQMKSSASKSVFDSLDTNKDGVISQNELKGIVKGKVKNKDGKLVEKEYIKLKVKQAIELMPSNGVVYREILNKIGEKAGYRKVIELRGVLYSNESNSKINITLNDKGELLNKPYKNYLLVYTDQVKQTDLIYVEDKFYKITDLGENMKIYNQMKLEEVQGLKLNGDNIIENNEIWDIYDIGAILDVY